MLTIRKLAVLGLATAAFGLAPATSAPAAEIPDVAGLLGTLATTAAGAVGEGAMGSILSQYGFGNATASQLQAVQARLDLIEGRLSALETGQANLAARIERSSFKAALTRTNGITAKLDTEFAELRAISGIQDPERRRLRTAKLLTDIRTGSTWSALAELDKDVSGVAGQTGLIAASSGVLRSEHRFFRQEQSLEARKVWHYFQYYEAIALQLQLEYREAHPAEYTQEENVAFVAAERTRIKHQSWLLKPLVPPHLAVDTTTGLGFDFRSVNTATLWFARFKSSTLELRDSELGIFRTLYTIVPQVADLQSMLRGHTGDPVTWLHKEAGGPATMTKHNSGYYVWTPTAFQRETGCNLFGFNCQTYSYAVAFVVKQSCYSDPDGTYCTPGPGHGQDLQLGLGSQAGLIHMLREPQNHWYYAAPPAAGGTT